MNFLIFIIDQTMCFVFSHTVTGTGVMPGVRTLPIVHLPIWVLDVLLINCQNTLNIHTHKRVVVSLTIVSYQSAWFNTSLLMSSDLLVQHHSMHVWYGQVRVFNVYIQSKLL